MPHRIHVYRPIRPRPERVTMQQYDEPLTHDIVLNARRTRDVRAITRRQQPVRVARGFEIRRDGGIIAVALELRDALPCRRSPTWLVITTSGPQCAWASGLHSAACEALNETKRAEQKGTADRLRRERNRREARQPLDLDPLDEMMLDGLC